MDISTLIPQLFYDVIGRIIPGTTLLASAFILFFGPEKGLTYLSHWSNNSNGENVSTVLIVLGNLLAAHVLASLLGGIWFRVYRLGFRRESFRRGIGRRMLKWVGRIFSGASNMGEKRIEKRLNHIKEVFGNTAPTGAKDMYKMVIAANQTKGKDGPNQPEVLSKPETWFAKMKSHLWRAFTWLFDKSTDPPETWSITDKIAFMYDYVILHCPKAGARIAKLRAEQHMSGVLMIGFLILAVCFLIFRHKSWPEYWKLNEHIELVETLLLSAAFCAGTLAWHLEKRCGAALINLWLIASSGETERA